MGRGMGWDGMEWDGMERNGLEWNGLFDRRTGSNRDDLCLIMFCFDDSDRHNAYTVPLSLILLQPGPEAECGV